MKTEIEFNLGDKHILYLLKRSTRYIDDCWVIGVSGNYTPIRLNGTMYNVHRLSAYLYHSLDIEDINIQVNHKVECSRPNCWNPNHIYIGSQSENLKDQVKRGTHHNAKKELCPRGHKYDQFIVRRRDGKISRRCSQCRRIVG